MLCKFVKHFLFPFEGKSNKHRNYELKGSKTDKVFNALGAISAAVVANAPCLLPEMQVNDLDSLILVY